MPKTLPAKLRTTITLDGCRAVTAGLIIEANLSRQRLQVNLEAITRVRGWSAWALGDLIAYHQRHFGKPDWDWLTAATGLGKKYLNLQAWAAEKYRLPDRNPGLSLAHHLRIAHLPVQTRSALLKRAAAKRWTMERLLLEAGIPFEKDRRCRRCLMTRKEILACRKAHEAVRRNGKPR